VRLPDGFTERAVAASRFSLKEQLTAFPGILRSDGVEIFLSLREVVPVNYKGRSVVVIHDVMALSFLWTYYRYNPAKKMLAYTAANLFVRYSLKKADVVVTVSNFSKREILNRVKLHPEKIRVIYPGIDERFAGSDARACGEVLQRYSIKEPYILFYGHFKPYKNLKRLILAYKRLSERDENSPYLVLGGGDPYYYDRMVRFSEEIGGIDGKIIFTGFIEDRDLPCVITGASLFVFPSTYEGFGLPVLEAMRCGVPVVVSKISPLVEVTQGSAVYVDPFDPDDIAAGIQKALHDEALRERLRRKGKEISRSFSWERAAMRFVEIFEELGA